MKVGDLVTHPFEKGVGIILKTPRWPTNDLDYLVHFSGREKPAWYRKDYLKVLSDESR
tara:strand:- start:421 stop:594 length:174 start_codon:yes stop_codon:yes gene_type:complete